MSGRGTTFRRAPSPVDLVDIPFPEIAVLTENLEVRDLKGEFWVLASRLDVVDMQSLVFSCDAA